MFGYACNETEALMPAPIYYSHRILHNIADAIKSGELEGLGPDAKGQVTLFYENGRPVGAKSVLVSIQHDEGMSQDKIREMIRPYILKTLPEGWMCEEKIFLSIQQEILLLVALMAMLDLLVEKL